MSDYELKDFVILINTKGKVKSEEEVHNFNADLKDLLDEYEIDYDSISYESKEMAVGFLKGMIGEYIVK